MESNTLIKKIRNVYSIDDYCNRIKYVDFAKGLTIILVIIGHTIWGIGRGAIFSFHMPLFFILSFVTYKQSNDYNSFVKNIEKSFKHLMIPTITIFFVNLFTYVFKNLDKFTTLDRVYSFAERQILSFCFLAPLTFDISDLHIPGIGMTYFCVTLFCGRTIYDYLCLKTYGMKRMMYLMALTFIGIYIGQIQNLPLDLDLALAMIPFYWVGNNISLFIKEDKKFLQFVAYSLIWMFGLLPMYFFKGTYLEIAIKRYPIFPISYAVAIAGTMMIVTFSVIICERCTVIMPLCYLGKNSLVMLIVHMFDVYILDFCGIYNLNNDYIYAFKRTLIDILVFYIVMIFVEWLRKKNIKL